MNNQVESIVIGGGQAGLAVSYHLKQRGHEHVVLDQADRPGSAWRNGRWDSFTLVTPNWTFQLPGAAYDGSSPDGFMPRDEIVSRFEAYVARAGLPVRFGVKVSAVERAADQRGYLVRAGDAVWQTPHVIVATGFCQHPKLPPFSPSLDAGLTQLHSGQYRNPTSLPDGAVLVVGSAQSGCQIAEELYQHGRRVYLSIGSAGRVPRRYRGRDMYEWLTLCGFFDQTADKLPSPQARFAGNPHLSGRDGGHSLNLHQFARDGVVLLGRVTSGSGSTLRLAPDRKSSLARVDKFEADVLTMVDGYIEQAGVEAEEETVPQLQDGYRADDVSELDLRAAGITTILWATGYAFDYSLVKLPAFEDNGFPVSRHGISRFPGLHFIGLPWLDRRGSGLLAGVGAEAARIADIIAGDPGLPGPLETEGSHRTN